MLSIARTWIPLIVMIRVASFVFAVVYVKTIVEVVTFKLTKVILVPPTEPEPTPELNSQPVGAVKVIVALVLPLGISLLAADVITIFPSVVKVGDVPFAALSAEIFVPPVAAVTVALSVKVVDVTILPI